MAKCASLIDTKPLVLPLEDCSEENRSEVGPKALGLNNLLKAGAVVPPGFCLTTSALKHFLRHDAALAGLIQSIQLRPSGDSEALPAMEVCVKIRQGILGSSVDGDLTDLIRDAYRKLSEQGGRTVAVRSSAAPENTGSSSAASHDDVVLGVSSEHDLLGAIKRVWANHYADDGMLLRELSALDQASGVAVIVQTMVYAAKSGEMFTANPSTMDRSTVFIEAAGQEGEVFSLGNPAHAKYYVNKVTFEVEKTVLPQNELVSEPVLSKIEIKRLVEAARSVDKFLRRPQEIEWVVEAAGTGQEGEPRLFFIGCRPISTHEVTKPAASSNFFSYVTSAVNKRVEVS